jgi:protein tyrosine phosphatase (PTP) superfamily phosphohydrolase (DUF442 family)
MVKRILGLPLVIGLCVSCLEGCNCCQRPSPCAPVAAWPPAGVNPCTPVPQQGAAPFVPGAPQPIPQVNSPPAPVFPESRRYDAVPPAAIQQQWRTPTDGRIQYLAPDNRSSAQSQDAARLQVPDLSTTPGASTAEPQQRQAFPSSIPQFAVAKEHVASGLAPIALDGLDWLRDNRFRTVLHLRPPSEDDSGERSVYESRGLKYESLAVSPETLTPAVVQKFNQLVADPANLPLFVYDKDGVLAGAMWYLHFRTADKASHQEAFSKATRLGFKEDLTDARKNMSVAIQKFLADQNLK